MNSVQATTGITRFGRRAAQGAILSCVLAVAAGAASPSRADQNLVIRDFVLTRGIVDREPTSAVESFSPSDGQGYLFTRIANDGAPTQITVVWRYEGTVHAEVDLDVGKSPGWRTWSSANLKPGDWTVELLDPEGVVLAQESFVVGSGLAGDPRPMHESVSGPETEQLSRDPGSSMPNPMPGSKPAADGDG